MNVDWKLLAPHKPVDPGSDLYVTPPSGGAKEIAEWILTRGSAVLVGGPAGIGKSTELARAAKLLQSDRIACLAPVDRWENMRRLTTDRLLLRLAGRLVFVATKVLNLPVSADLRALLVKEGVLDDASAARPGGGFSATPRTALEQAIGEVYRLSGWRRVVFLIDGLEKVPPGALSGELFDELGTLPDTVDLVTVVPWHASFGARADAILRVGEKFRPLRAPEVHGELGEAGRQFLLDILVQRLSLEAEDLDPAALVAVLSGDLETARATIAARREIVMDAARWSGGVPRIFLQLLADAGTNARLRRDASFPEQSDLTDAVADQQDSFRRLLLPGDTESIQAIAGTDGREMEMTRKIRLMAHGLLLERLRDRRPILEIHPLARAAIEEGRHHA